MVLLPVALGLAACRPTPPAEPERFAVQVAPARDAASATDQRGAVYLAFIKGRNEVTLSFRVGGIVDRIGPEDGSGDWQEGARVAPGTLLARLQQTDFEEEVRAATAQEELDRTQYARTERLFRDGAASQQDLDRARAARVAAEALLQQRRQELQDSRIVASVGGTVLRRSVSRGETVGPGQPVITVADLSEVEIEVGVPDRLVGDLRVGTPVPLEISATGERRFVGTVAEVGAAAREGSRLFRVLIRLPNPDGAIRPGMTASVRLDAAEQRRQGVLVPLSALVARGERELGVFVVTNGIARERRVEAGDLVRSWIVVTRHLEPGEEVVVAGASQLHDGAPVRAVPGSTLLTGEP